MYFAKNSLVLVLVLFLTGTLVAGAANAATYYVASSGSDGAAGTSSSPWRTLQYAANAVSAGDVVLVADGTYAGFNVSTGGTQSSPIVFRANGSNVLVNTDNSSTSDIINVEGADT